MCIVRMLGRWRSGVGARGAILYMYVCMYVCMYEMCMHVCLNDGPEPEECLDDGAPGWEREELSCICMYVCMRCVCMCA